MRYRVAVAAALLLLSAATVLSAQVSRASFQDALKLNERYAKAAGMLPGQVHWIDGLSAFWFEETDGTARAYVIFHADTLQREALDLHALTESMSKAMTASNNAASSQLQGEKLKLEELRFDRGGHGIHFRAAKHRWHCTLPEAVCTIETESADGDSDVSDDGAPRFEGNDPHRALVSPDGQWAATIENENVFLRPIQREKAKDTSGNEKALALSHDGSEGNYYQFSSLMWSPDSKHLLARRTVPGMRRMVHYVESSPEDQLQPKWSSHFYAKPGDVLDREQPVLFDIANRREIAIADTLFPNPFELNRFAWKKDSSAFTFEYNQRGHQRYSVLSVDAASGLVRPVIDETSATFVEYSETSASQYEGGKYFRRDLDDGKQIVWMSERDGWAHLYLYDGATGKVKHRITQGNWVVRDVDRVDEKTGEVYFEASGVDPKIDPYFVAGYRIGLDGNGMTRITEEPAQDGPANHRLAYSEDGQYYVDSYSRVDLAPRVVLHRTKDNAVLAEVAKGDLTNLRAAGWQPPEVFTAKGRDGKTDIWGLIYRPAHFDPQQKYPVVESIYAGPQGSFVPKSFTPRTQALTDLGFVVVQIDGMGTNNRSKAFHDVIWKNLKDAGFADRILWHQAVAARYPWYDITRVGIFGTSAGGQSAMGALLFHPEFYKAAVANSGCHDNRMDKIWWNEQWMGWPVGPEYAASSNVDNAYRLQGRLLLVEGEMDTNVDPSSTMQVVNALIKAEKDFEFLEVPGGGHGAGGDYGERRLMDFFIRSLQGSQTVNWNETSTTPSIPTVGH